MFLLFGNHSGRAFTKVFLRAFSIACVFAFRPYAVPARSGRFCRGGLASDGLVPGRLCRVGFTGLDCAGSDCAGAALPGWLYRIGFAGAACAGLACAGSDCAVRPARTRARGNRSHGSLREVSLTVKQINTQNRCFIE